MLTPRPYQLAGSNFLRSKKRAMIYDVPGAGKTLQAAEAAERPVLVLCPTYLVEQWHDFIRAQYPNDTAMLITGNHEERQRYLTVPCDWYIANIEMLRTIVRTDKTTKRVTSVSSYDFPHVKTMIVDESHRLRGRNSKQTERALLLAAATERVYLLTATPQYKAVDDWFAQLRLLDPKLFSSYYRFVARFCETKNNGWSEKVVGLKNKGMFNGLINCYALGRNEVQIGRPLTEPVDKLIRVSWSDAARARYNRVKKEHRDLHGTPLLTASEVYVQLRRMTVCEEKLEALDQVLEDANEQALIFTFYRETAHTVATRIKGLELTGAIPASERVALAKAERTRHIVATIDSLSEGIDLSHLNHVVLFEEDYVPGKFYQAFRRVHRDNPTRKRPVILYTLQVRGTVDELVHAAAKGRIESFEELLKRSLL